MRIVRHLQHREQDGATSSGSILVKALIPAHCDSMVRAAWGSEYAWGGRYTGRPAILNFALVLRRQVEELQVEGVEFVGAGLVPPT